MLSKLFPFGLTLLLVACGGGSGGSAPATTPAVATPAVTPSLAVAIPSASYPAGSAELGGWTTLQQARVLCGFGALKQNLQLDAAALAHARYLTNKSIASTVSVLSHYERNASNLPDTGNPDYTGEYPWDRTSHQGYGTQVAEILQATVWNYNIANPPVFPTMEQRGADSMLSLLNTVYHLMGAMYHGADVGFGADMKTAASGSARREEYRFGSLNGYQTQRTRLGTGNLATYPCEGSSNIPPAFAPADESPNPFPAMTSSSQMMGSPIYLKVDAGQVLTLTSSNISTGGVSVATATLTQTNDPQAEIGANEVFVVPTSALRANTNYQVNLAGTINNTPFSRSFAMRTGS